MLSYLKNRTGYHRDAECAEGEWGKWEWEEGVSLPSGLGGDGERRSSVSRGPGRIPDFVHILSEKPHLVNNIMLNVAECCVIKLLK